MQRRGVWGSFLSNRVTETSKKDAQGLFADPPEGHEVQSPLTGPWVLSHCDKSLFCAALDDVPRFSISTLKDKAGDQASDRPRQRIRPAWCRMVTAISGPGECVKSASKIKPKLRRNPTGQNRIVAKPPLVTHWRRTKILPTV